MSHKIDWDEVSRLQKRCEEHEGISLKLNWGTLLNRQNGQEWDLVEYRNGELAAFLGRYPFGGKLEICGMVDPKYRRQGIFDRLLGRALDPSTSAAYSEILLNAPAASLSAKAFLSRVSCRYAFSEYQMKYEPTTDLRRIEPSDIALRHAGPQDTRLLANLDAEGFRENFDEAFHDYETLTEKEIRRNELIVQNGIPVGKIRVLHLERESWIYGFVVSAAHRGHGIGSAALRLVIDRERAAGYDVWLEVALNNPSAMKLYESSGFAVRQVQDYYGYEAE